ncbi:hypothetical protein A2982_03135 [candidate division WWE3 bacterium RIFCSPLOWO2_01_FULL_39_13]|uniref:Uncharacterized protein n=1 Tax=candidate division WWE3 bacterium RIFCSPLOWO2_01_FULL_39_13 TaxID=1802624 RepID=A0A1F4V1S0_UNCKA|nr:MAG: hypothetical protein A2982_03135 [candidate division WWE3 bacterium RIFCSPLOWO2_01_FULL_39_13]
MSVSAARYKIPILISLVIGLALVALRRETFWFFALMSFLGSIAGVLFLDLEYIVNSYFIDPMSESAVRIKELIGSKNIKGFISYINDAEDTFGEGTVRSILFQIILIVFTFYVITTRSWVFVQGMVLSMSACLLYYQIIEYSRTKTLQRWFWIYNQTPSRTTYSIYLVIIGLALLFQFTLIER